MGWREKAARGHTEPTALEEAGVILSIEKVSLDVFGIVILV